MKDFIPKTKAEFEAVKEGYNHYYPYEAGLIPLPAKPVTGKFTDSSSIHTWNTSSEFFRTLNITTGVTSRNDVKYASAVLEKMAADAPETVEFKGAEEPENPANMPSKDLLEQMEKKGQLTKEEVERLKALSDNDIQRAINQKIKIIEQQRIIAEQTENTQALKTALDGKKIYVKVEKPAVDFNEQVANLHEELNSSPTSFVAVTTKVYEAKLENQKLTPLQKEFIAQRAALTTYESLSNKTPLERAAIIKAVTAPDAINQITSDPEMQRILQAASKGRFNALTSQSELYRQFVDIKKMHGVGTLEEVKVVDISETPKEGYEEVDINEEIITPHLESLSDQSDVLQGIRMPLDIGVDKIKEQLIRKAGDSLVKKVASLPKDSLVSKTFNSEIVQFGLSQMGFVVPSTWIAVEGSWVGNFVVGSGFGPVAGLLQGITGVDFGVVQVISLAEGGEVVGGIGLMGSETALTIGGDLAGGIGLGGAAEGVGALAAGGAEGAVAAEAAAGAATAVAGEAVVAAGAGAEVAAATGIGGLLGSIPGAIIAAVAAAIIAFLPDIKEFADKYRGEFFTAGILALSMGGILGSVALIAVGAPLSIIGGASMIAGGAGLGSIAGAIGGFIATMFAGVMSTIGKPILIAMISFPVIVALILFIINAGAYVVPPGIPSLLANQNAYIDVQKAANPPGPFQNSDLPLNITYTIIVSAKQQILTSVTVHDDCTVVSKSGQTSCGSSDYAVPNGTINVGLPFTYTYPKSFDASFKDSIVLNTVTVTARVVNETAVQTATGGTSITIGSPPTGCLVADPNQWPKGEYFNDITYAMTKLTSDHPEYVSKVCSSFTKILLLYEPNNNGNYWGWNDLEASGVATIHFYSLGVKNPADALYTLSHELGHSLASGIRTAYIYAAYLVTPGITSEAPYCFYRDTIHWNAGESMPEAIALYAIAPRPGCPSVQQSWPIHYQFLKKYIFN